MLSTVYTGCRKHDTDKPPDIVQMDSERADTEPLNLSTYVCVTGPHRIPSITNDASGLAFSPHTRTLFMVVNGTCEIAELGTQGDVRRIIETSGFSDLEGIAHVQKDLFYVAEEGRGTVCSIRIQKNTESISRRNTDVLTVDPGSLGNSGIEGLSYDPGRNCLFAVKEKNPRKIYRIRLQNTKENCRAPVTLPWNIEKNHYGLTDLSGICFHPDSGNLLILSHESAVLAEVTVRGAEVSRLRLSAGSSGLNRSVPQAEGIAVDTEGTVYICSEPNLFYVFRKKK
jgi:uncharacterized protein YjiK